MNNIFRSLFSVFVLGTVIVCEGAPLGDSSLKVDSQGVTDIAAVFGRTKVAVRITTHEVNIGKPGGERPQKITSSCTYSRFPCSPVDYLEISVNGNALFVARSVYADLADIAKARLSEKKEGQYVLTLNGGDASESYTVEVLFNGNLVKKRTLMSNEAREIMQETTYFTSLSMDD